MSHPTYFVVRRAGGWAVQYDETELCCYRTQEQAIAQARLIGRERGQAEIRVQEPVSGRFRIEAMYGAAPVA
jgi:hypothetical protein